VAHPFCRPGAGINPSSHSIDFAEFYLESALYTANEEQLMSLAKNEHKDIELSFKTRFAAPLHVQVRTVERRDPLLTDSHLDYCSQGTTHRWAGLCSPYGM
jgi:hypothetical protein